MIIFFALGMIRDVYISSVCLDLGRDAGSMTLFLTGVCSWQSLADVPTVQQRAHGPLLKDKEREKVQNLNIFLTAVHARQKYSILPVASILFFCYNRCPVSSFSFISCFILGRIMLGPEFGSQEHLPVNFQKYTSMWTDSNRSTR